ncbi:putative 2-aminoethylphosphonate ABC transporter ATP-binding protein [Roseovarius sp. LXJ103]|uniref:putative 2-aminoethylphosphonate ABC transporter ATP-binding protein n=1 Tax=Roseovarius carneus TaxID=2853164 RepID=UPI000D616CF1|nr:putative 2-aminoethylphosphonate ABC transporter ATP-binding protein [Roseovarius carneus]MBZ8119557.1 putative 2-aminoethylphosphonate ABC transporter ATP-binding protein [Roseovarius carneus]PWE34819.1 putative 2-aminoethylphosphonate ABC transporter ATP-binding protein [Pelagicola sp. LXJ1103]
MTPTGPEPYLKVTNLWKAFGKFLALKDVSLDIFEGELVCFLGPSGCGKTTLLRAIAGLDLQTKGGVSQGGKDVSNLPPSERDFGIVFQSYALFPNLTIEKNVAFGLENTGRSRSEIIARVTELLSLVGLEDQRRKYPAQLSGGQQQRIALARAIATNPGLLLLDEPLSALDAKVRVHLRHEIKELQRQLGVTTVMVTHDQEEALAMADRIVVMKDGVIEQVGTPTEVYRAPQTLFVADFIGEMNQFPATAGSGDTIVIGGGAMQSLPHEFAEGEEILAAIRPEDVIPHGDETNMLGSDDVVETPENCLEVVIAEMEFLGSFWRSRLRHARFGDGDLIADLSINAVRRFSLETGSKLTVELPRNRLMAFARPETAEAPE